MPTNPAWLEVDLGGLRRVVAGRPNGAWAIKELIANSLDAQATTINVTIQPTKARGLVEVVVEDNGPNGWADLSSAYTVFGHSSSAAHQDRRGRFGMGDKYVLAVAREATIATMDGTVRFDADGTRHDRPRSRRDNGTVATFIMRWSQSFTAATITAVRSEIIPPKGVQITVNGEPLHRPTLLGSSGCYMTAVVYSPGDDALTKSRRMARVEWFTPGPDHVAGVYEQGMAVGVLSDSDDAADVIANVTDIKVPVDQSRDAVSPSTAKQIMTGYLDWMASEDGPGIDEVTAQAAWSLDPVVLANNETVVDYINAKFGSDAVTFSPGDPESNKRATDDGRTLVYGGSMPGSLWNRVSSVRQTRPGLLPSSRSEYAAQHAVGLSPDGVPPISLDDYTPEHHRLHRLTKMIADKLDVPVGRVEIYDDHMLGFYGVTGVDIDETRWVGINAATCTTLHVALETIVHELAHVDGGADHLSDKFHQEVGRLGVRLAMVGADLATYATWDELLFVNQR